MLTEPRTAYIAQGVYGYLTHKKYWTEYVHQAKRFDNMQECEAFAKDEPDFVKVKEIVIF